MSKEQARDLQRKLRFLNRKGCFVEVKQNKEMITSGVIDGIVVTDVDKDSAKIIWKEVWYDEPQFIHEVELLGLSVDDKTNDDNDGEQWFEFVAHDKSGYTYRFSMLAKGVEPDKDEIWNRWQKHRMKNKKMYAGIDKSLLEGIPNMEYIMG